MGSPHGDVLLVVALPAPAVDGVPHAGEVLRVLGVGVPRPLLRPRPRPAPVVAVASVLVAAHPVPALHDVAALRVQQLVLDPAAVQCGHGLSRDSN